MYPTKLNAEGFPAERTLVPSNAVLTAYNGTHIQQYGTMTIPCSYRGKRCDAEFYVSSSTGPAILGLPSCRELRLVEMNCEVKETLNRTNSEARIASKSDLIDAYPDRFEGIGSFRGEFHITIDKSVPPVVHSPRRCPIHLKDEVKTELEKMEELGVITKVSAPTDWVSSIVYSRKSNNKLRICLDPKDLNRAIKRPHYKTPTLDEITHQLAGSRVFSKLDARHGYWSVSLDEPSSYLTTFNSPFGRYRFERLPFGLNLSQDVFQERMDHILERCPGTMGIADDVAVFGKDEKEHDANLHNLMKIAQQEGLVFNPDKCDIKKQKMRFFGLEFSSQGVNPDPEKIAAISQLQTPKDAVQLREFLGIATYMAPFAPNLSQHTATLRELLKNDADFQWTPSHETAFKKIKRLICKEITLSYFDPRAETQVQVDASSHGLGAVLLQNGRPIAFASKSLSDCERRYANIEREMLAVVFGCERFHTYVYGKRFTIQSDHKPLEMIHLKNLAAAPQRLQRMLLRIQPYDIVIKYKPGKEVTLADSMSRQPCSNSESLEFDVQISHVQFSTRKLDELRRETRNDDKLQSLLKVIADGWPDRQRDVHPQLRAFWPFRDELVADDGIVLKGNQIVMPASLHAETLAKLHESHQGIEKTRLRARSCVFWNGINQDIEDVVRKCATCQQMQRAQQRQPLMPHETPSRAWQIVGTDLFVINRETYLLVSDYYSKFPFVYVIPSPVTSTAVIAKMKSLFAEQGVPQRVISDNGGHFSSDAFRRFADQWCFDHVTSSPHYPQSNGFVERNVQTVKQTLKKVGPRSDIQMALLVLRATPIDSHLPSPAELLYGRRVVSNLPVATWNTSGERCEIRARLDQRQATAKERHDARGVTDLAELYHGQHVRTRNPITHRWEPGRIAEKCSQPRSYRVESPSGRVLQKNRRDIRETVEKHVFLNPDDEPQRDTRETAANGPRPITVEPHANSSESSTAEPVEPPVVTPASVEPAEELACSPSRRISDKRVRFQPEQKRYYTRSGRLSKPPSQYNE